MPKTLDDLTPAQTNFIRWAVRDFLILWCSQSLISEEGEFSLDKVPDRYSRDPEFVNLVHEFAQCKGLVSKRNEFKLTAKAWKEAAAQIKN